MNQKQKQNSMLELHHQYVTEQERDAHEQQQLRRQHELLREVERWLNPVDRRDAGGAR